MLGVIVLSFVLHQAPSVDGSCRLNTSELVRLHKRGPDKWGGPQGIFLEGRGLERFSFEGRFRDVANWQPRKGVDACTQEAFTPSITLVEGSCKPRTKLAWQCEATSSNRAICGVGKTPTFTVIVVEGHWNASGKYESDRTTLSCFDGTERDETKSNGAIAGCVTRWPMFTTTQQELNACIHAYRADFAGDGQTHTAPGTWIDMQRTTDIPITQEKLEAEWSADGPVDFHHPRVASDLFNPADAGYTRNDGGVWSRSGGAILQTRSAEPDAGTQPQRKTH